MTPEYLDDPRPDPNVLARLEQRQDAERHALAVSTTLNALRARRAHLDALISMLEAERVMSQAQPNPGET